MINLTRHYYHDYIGTHRQYRKLVLQFRTRPLYVYSLRNYRHVPRFVVVGASANLQSFTLFALEITSFARPKGKPANTTLRGGLWVGGRLQGVAEASGVSERMRFH